MGGVYDIKGSFSAARKQNAYVYVCEMGLKLQSYTKNTVGLKINLEV